MSEHTPGPWRYQREDGFNPPFGHEVLFEVYTSTGLYGNPATCKKEDDARLIAAAPELLEVLKEFRDSLYFERNTESVKAKAIAAIAKAEAKS